jgi:hypothetical protein
MIFVCKKGAGVLGEGYEKRPVSTDVATSSVGWRMVAVGVVNNGSVASGRYTSPSWSSWPWKKAQRSQGSRREYMCVRSMSEIKTALLTVRQPIQLKRVLVGTSSSHRLDSISNKSTPVHCLHPRFFFSIFESELKIESSLSVRDESLPSCRRSATVNPSLAPT